MHFVARDARLLLLAASAGSADSWSYFGLGHAFVANMTGNTVLLGLAVFQNHGDLLHPFLSLACYAAGAVIGSLLTRHLRPGALWSRAISWSLLLEACLLLAAEAGWAVMGLHPHRAHTLYWLLATVALAVGIQSGAMLQLKIPGIVTTYITGTWTTLLSGLVRLASRQQTHQASLEFEDRLFLQAAVLSIYFLSAVAAGWLFRYLPLAVGALPSLCVFLVAMHSLLRPQIGEM